MFGLDDVDLRDIALEIAKEPATKEDGKPLITNGKPVTKIEKILRSWAISDNPDLQKKFVEITTKEEKLDDASQSTLIFLLVLACEGTPEKRIEIMEMVNKYKDTDLLGDAITEAKQITDRLKLEHIPKSKGLDEDEARFWIEQVFKAY